MKAAPAFAPHLVILQHQLPAGAEWMPEPGGWTFLQIRSGISYWQQPGEALEIPAGSTLVLTGEAPGALRASRLGEVTIHSFRLEPGKLTGLLTLTDEHALKKAAAREPSGFRILPPLNPLSERFKILCLNPNGAVLRKRLQLVQLFVDLFNGELETERQDLAPDLDGRGRLRQFLNQTAAAELVDISLSDLAPRMHCSPRHLSRLFRQEVGASFREKQTEVRLARACELLATSNVKVVDVALTSGYQSPSLFNLVFKRHFGMSPGKWREQQGARRRSRPKFVRALRA
jgi:AraC-like DNA-binding protein